MFTKDMYYLLEVIRTSDCDVAHNTLEAQSLAVCALWTLTNLITESTLVLQFDALLHVERGRT